MEECTEQAVQTMLPQVSDQRREQALRFRYTLGRFCCLKSWLMLQEEMKSFNVQLSTFNYEKSGKPFLENGPCFSISHCKTGIAVVVDDRPVGIDIESIRRVDPELVNRTMNEAEQALIASSETPERAFTRLWTQKEAVLKMEGTGIESFEQLQTILSKYRNNRAPLGLRNIEISTIEKEKYIYTIAYV